MERFRPRILVCREIAHDVGHDSFDLYLSAVKTTDDAIGRVFDWVRNHPYFSQNTAIVIRPEFGRDDVVNDHGHLHHSFGFYCTHRVASIFWGPDFNRGVDRATVINAMDMAPTLTRVFGVDAIHSQGRVVPGLFH
jgi:arylsulfatase A-like enzyme